MLNFSQAGILAFVLMQFIDALVKPAIEIANAGLRGENVRERALELWPLYVTVAVISGLAWFTGLNALPFFEEAPVIGRILTCIGIGLGPSFLHDLKPTE